MHVWELDTATCVATMCAHVTGIATVDMDTEANQVVAVGQDV